MEKNFWFLVLYVFVFCLDSCGFKIIEEGKRNKIRKVQHDSKHVVDGGEFRPEENAHSNPSVPSQHLPKHKKSKFPKHFAFYKSKQQPQPRQQIVPTHRSTSQILVCIIMAAMAVEQTDPCKESSPPVRLSSETGMAGTETTMSTPPPSWFTPKRYFCIFWVCLVSEKIIF